MGLRQVLQTLLKGVIVAVALAGVGVLLYEVYKINFPEKERFGQPAPTEEEVANRETWEEAEARRAREEKVKAELLGLDEFYTPLYVVVDLRATLYRDKDFDALTNRLESIRDNAATPFERYRYGESLRYLAHGWEGMSSGESLAVLDEWVAAYPQSYFPYVVRSQHHLHISRHAFQNFRYRQSTTEDAKILEFACEKAAEDLNRASELNDTDAEVFAAWANLARTNRSGVAAVREHYKETIERNPHHVGVRYTMLYALWENTRSPFALAEFLKSNEAAVQEFPHLHWISRAASYIDFSTERLSGGERPNSDEAFRIAADRFRMQAEQTPDELTVLAIAAFFAGKAGDTENAARFFVRTGNTYPVTSVFENIYQFHQARMTAFLEAIDSPNVARTPLQKELLDQALAAEPTNGPLSRKYLRYLLRTRDDDSTRNFFEKVRDPYIMTGTVGDPPDYRYVEALAIANGLFWDHPGVSGEPAERIVLDRAMELAPENAFVHLIYAEHYVTRKEYRKARELLERARELDPAYLPALHTMAWLSYHEEKWDEGIALAKELLASGDFFYVRANIADANEIIELCEKKKAESGGGFWPF